MATVRLAPCQCCSPGANQTTSPGRISSTGPPHFCALPTPEMTISVCPSGCVCHAVRAPGSKVTLAPRTRAGFAASNSGSTRTAPVKYSSGPLPDGREPHRLISMTDLQSCCPLVPKAAPHPYSRILQNTPPCFEQSPSRLYVVSTHCALLSS